MMTMMMMMMNHDDGDDDDGDGDDGTDGHKYDSCDRLSLHARPGAERPRHHSAPSPAPSPSSLLRGYSLTAVTNTAEHLP